MSFYPIKLYFDNIIFSLQKAGGISVVWFELISRALVDQEIETSFIEVANENIIREQFKIPNEHFVHSVRKLPVSIQRYLNPTRLKGKGIFHSSYYRTVKHPQMVNVTTVHDFTYEYFRNGLAKFIHCTQKANAIRNSDKIICVSENTKSDLLKFHPKIAEQQIRVIYNGVDSVYGQLTNRKESQLKELIPFSSKEYALFIGDRKSNHKNFRLAAESCKKTNTPLLAVGGGSISKTEKDFLSNIGLIDFFQIGGLSNTILNLLYNHALCLIYPSAYEGFGIPVLEAQKAGCPVIASNNSSIPEVVGNGAFLMNKISTNNLSELIQHIKTNSKSVSEIIANGLENSNRFSWDVCYQQTKDLYKELYKEYF